MKFSELSDIVNKELEGMLKSLRSEIFTVRMKSKMIEKKELIGLRSKRSDVARILTLLKKREGQEN